MCCDDCGDTWHRDARSRSCTTSPSILAAMRMHSSCIFHGDLRRWLALRPHRDQGALHQVCYCEAHQDNYCGCGEMSLACRHAQRPPAGNFLFAGTANDMPLILGYPCSRSLVCTMFFLLYIDQSTTIHDIEMAFHV
jgi:hypothetical protein